MNAAATISSPAGLIVLNAGDAAIINGTLVSGNTTTVNVDFGNADGGFGGSLLFAGDVDAPLAIFNGAADTVGDSFNTIKPDQDVGCADADSGEWFRAGGESEWGFFGAGYYGFGYPGIDPGAWRRNGSFSFGCWRHR